MKQKIILLCCYILTLLPRFTKKPILYFISRLAWFVDKRSKRISFKNIDIAYPDKKQNWKNKLAKKSYFNAIYNSADILWLKNNRSTVHNIHILDEAMQMQKGVCLLTLHLGSWEIIAKSIADKGYPLTMITNVPKSFNFIEYCYQKAKIRYVNRKQPNMLFKLIQYTKDKNIICFFSDQFSSDTTVNFFGTKTMAPTGGINFAIMMKIPAVIAWTWKDSHNRNNINFEKFEIKNIENKSDNIKHNTQRLINHFESLIRKYPDQWLWCYNRFKNIK